MLDTSSTSDGCSPANTFDRRADAEELLGVVDADTCFRAATRTSPD